MSLPSFLGCSLGHMSCLSLPFCPLAGSPRIFSPGSVLCPHGCEMQVAADGLDFSFVNNNLRNCFILLSSWEFEHKTFVWGSHHRPVCYQTLAFQLLQHDCSRHSCFLRPLDIYGLLCCTGSFFPSHTLQRGKRHLLFYTQCNEHGSVTAALD